MKYKIWIFQFLVFNFFVLVVILVINYFINPFWTFNHKYNFMNYQHASNERIQKSNLLYFHPRKYRSLIFGSSRGTYINQNIISKDTFNYAVSDMQPNEYIYYLNFAINKAKQPIKTVYIGLDFFGALEYSPIIAKHPTKLLEPITKKFYKYTQLLSKDSCTVSFKNIKYQLKKKKYQYNRDYLKILILSKRISLNQFNKNIENDIKIYLRDRYSTKYNQQYINLLKKLKNKFPNIKFIFFTTPVTQKHFEALKVSGHYKDYEKWLKQVVEVFGYIHHFMYINKITKQANIYFSDSNHAYTTTYNCIMNQIVNKKSLCPQIDLILDKNNIDQKLKYLFILNH